MAGQMAQGHQQGHQAVGVVVVEAEAGVQGQVQAIVVAVAPGVLLRELADGVRQLVVVTLGGERATLALLVVVEAAGAVEVEAVLAAGEVAVEVEVDGAVAVVRVRRDRRTGGIHRCVSYYDIRLSLLFLGPCDSNALVILYVDVLSPRGCVCERWL